MGNNKQGYSFTLEEDNINWLDQQIEEKQRWRSRSHAIDEFIRREREKANAGGEAVATNPQ